MTDTIDGSRLCKQRVRRGDVYIKKSCRAYSYTVLYIIDNCILFREANADTGKNIIMLHTIEQIHVLGDLELIERNGMVIL